jgi:hypothetical protein
MPAKRSMADLLREQRVSEDPLAIDTAVQRGAQPREDPGTASASAPMAAAVPEPRAAAADGPLDVGEQADLSICEAALDNLRMAFWAAGKALQTVRDGRLYRDGYATFEEYADQRWDMSRSQAYRLIEAWPLAERLSPIGDTITESQIRELLPVAGRHGEDAAAVVYETVVEVDGVKVTAAVLHKVVGILPAGNFDRDEAVAQIRAYLAGELIVREIPPADPVRAFTAGAAKVVTDLQRVPLGDLIKAAREADPGAAGKAVADLRTALRAALDEIDREIPAQ